MTFARASAFLAILVCGCAAPDAPPPVIAPPALSPTVTVAPPPSAAPSVAPAAARPPVDPAADRDKLALVEGLCAAAIKHDRGEVLVGCRTCPPFDGDTGHPDGTVAVDPEEFYPLELRIPGAFTRPGASEIAAVFQGCESHAENLGGTLLVEKTASGYKRGPYFSGLHPESCKPYRRPDGRDLLVCQWADAHQSTAFSNAFVYDFTQGKPEAVEAGWKDLVTVHDTSFQLCTGIDPTLGVNQGSILGFRFEDRDGDKRPDLVIDIDHRHTASSAALTAKVAKACAKDPDNPSVDAGTLLGKPEKATIELLFDGQSFKPSPKSEKILKGL